MRCHMDQRVKLVYKKGTRDSYGKPNDIRKMQAVDLFCKQIANDIRKYS